MTTFKITIRRGFLLPEQEDQHIARNPDDEKVSHEYDTLIASTDSNTPYEDFLHKLENNGNHDHLKDSNNDMEYDNDHDFQETKNLDSYGGKPGCFVNIHCYVSCRRLPALLCLFVVFALFGVIINIVLTNTHSPRAKTLNESIEFVRVHLRSAHSILRLKTKDYSLQRHEEDYVGQQQHEQQQQEQQQQEQQQQQHQRYQEQSLDSVPFPSELSSSSLLLVGMTNESRTIRKIESVHPLKSMSQSRQFGIEQNDDDGNENYDDDKYNEIFMSNTVTDEDFQDDNLTPETTESKQNDHEYKFRIDDTNLSEETLKQTSNYSHNLVQQK